MMSPNKYRKPRAMSTQINTKFGVFIAKHRISDCLVLNSLVAIESLVHEFRRKSEKSMNSILRSTEFSFREKAQVN